MRKPNQAGRKRRIFEKPKAVLPEGLTLPQYRRRCNRNAALIMTVSVIAGVALGLLYNKLFILIMLLLGASLAARILGPVVDLQAELEEAFDLREKNALFAQVFPKFKYDNSQCIPMFLLKESEYGGNWDASGGNEYLSGVCRGVKVEMCHVELGKAPEDNETRVAKKPPKLVMNARWMVLHGSFPQYTDEQLQEIVDRYRGSRPIIALRKGKRVHIIYNKNDSGVAEFRYYLIRKVVKENTTEAVSAYCIEELTVFKDIMQAIIPIPPLRRKADAKTV